MPVSSSLYNVKTTFAEKGAISAVLKKKVLLFITHLLKRLTNTNIQKYIDFF